MTKHGRGASDAQSLGCAAWVFQNLVPDLELRYAEPPDPDFIGWRAGEPRALVEVTRVTDDLMSEALSAVDASRARPIVARGCARSWSVRPRLGSRISDIRRGIDRALAELEACGEAQFVVWFDRGESVAHEGLAKLGVEQARAVADAHPPRIVFENPIGEEFTTDVPGALARLERDILKPDNLRKVAPRAGHERHLVLVVETLESETSWTLETAEAMPRLDSIPDGLTVWAIVEWPSPIVVWQSRPGPWVRHEVPARWVPVSRPTRG